jgi:fumarate reductase flavoprotein subunit
MSRDGNWVVGLNAGAPEATVEARAVVLADGGFQANPALLRKYVGTDQVKRRATGTGQGDGLKMGLSVGGVAVNTSGFYGHLLALRALSDDQLWPYPILDALGSVGIVVGPAGRRLVDETHSGVTTTNAIAWSSDPLGHFVVFDDEAWNAEGRQGVTPANPHLIDHGATVFSAAILDELCRLAGIDQRGLAASTESVLRDPTHADPPRARPPKLSVPPFYAIPLVCGVTFTMGGLKVDGCARVLDRADSPIPGLFAAGGTMGGLHGGPRAGYAGGLLEAAVFGLLAGETAARRG